MTTVDRLIKKLQAIEDREIKVLFFCENCGHYVPVDEMKAFGFIRPDSLKPSPLMQRLAEVMPKEAIEKPFSPTDLMSSFKVRAIKMTADSFAAWMKDDLPQNNRELCALLWTFGEILNGDMERRLNHALKIGRELDALGIKPLTIPVPEDNNGNKS